MHLTVHQKYYYYYIGLVAMVTNNLYIIFKFFVVTIIQLYKNKRCVHTYLHSILYSKYIYIDSEESYKLQKIALNFSVDEKKKIYTSVSVVYYIKFCMYKKLSHTVWVGAWNELCIYMSIYI